MKKTTAQIITTLLLVTLLVAGCSVSKPSAQQQVQPADTNGKTNGENGTIYDLPDIAKLDVAERLVESSIHSRANSANELAMAYIRSAFDLLASINESALDTILFNRRDLLSERIDSLYGKIKSDDPHIVDDTPPDAVLRGEIVFDSDSTDEEDLAVLKSEIDTIGFERSLTLSEFPPIPMVMNMKVENAIRYFQGKGSKFFSRWLDRGGYYIPLFQRILREEGMPEDLVYLSMIESGFSPKAYSWAHASGPWQFIRATGRRYGLHIDSYYDERRDPVKATYAAIGYLKKLYAQFGDWYLAMAGYNCGEGAIERHTRKYKTNDYWKLHRLPRETRNYVPLFLAAATIAKNPTAYGFDPIVFRDWPPVDSVLVTEVVDLELAADLVGVSYDSLKALNPTFLRWCTPLSLDSVWMYLPYGTSGKFNQKLALLPADKKKMWDVHIVRRGETLGSIAKKYGTTINEIVSHKENKIRNRNKLRVGQSIYIPTKMAVRKPKSTTPAEPVEVVTTRPDSLSAPEGVEVVGLTAPAEEQSNSVAPVVAEPVPQPKYHRVRRGENLQLIGNKYGVTVAELKQWNKKIGAKGVIHPNQTLRVNDPSIKAPPPPPPPSKVVDATMDETPSGTNEVADSTSLPATAIADTLQSQLVSQDPNAPVHVVQAGETLIGITDRYRITLNDLVRVNNLAHPYLIKPGDTLIVKSAVYTPTELAERQPEEEAEPEYKLYKIKRGDTLGAIASRNRTTVSALKKLNKIKNPKKLRQGQTIKIPAN